MERKIRVLNLPQLLKDMEEYRKMFPISYTDMDKVFNVLKQHMEVKHVDDWCFGIEVSSDWQDKCYVFEAVESAITANVWFKYNGVGKI